MTWLSEILAGSSQRPIVALLTLDSSGWANPLRLARDRTTTSRGLVFVGTGLDAREVEAGLEGLRPGLLRFDSTPERARLLATTTAPSRSGPRPRTSSPAAPSSTACTRSP